MTNNTIVPLERQVRDSQNVITIYQTGKAIITVHSVFSSCKKYSEAIFAVAKNKMER